MDFLAKRSPVCLRLSLSLFVGFGPRLGILAMRKQR